MISTKSNVLTNFELRSSRNLLARTGLRDRCPPSLQPIYFTRYSGSMLLFGTSVARLRGWRFFARAQGLGVRESEWAHNAKR